MVLFPKVKANILPILNSNYKLEIQILKIMIYIIFSAFVGRGTIMT